MKSINKLAQKMSCSRIETSNLAFWFFLASHPFRVNFVTAKAMCKELRGIYKSDKIFNNISF